MLSTYYQLAKPGIVYGNALSAIGGFLLASKGDVDWLLFGSMLVGICLVMASACVVNNVIDHSIDAQMSRTKKRALVTGQVSIRQALLYAAVLGSVGMASLLLTNVLAVGLAVAGFLFYVVLYGIWKRRSPFGTVVGSVSGAIPPVVGYSAVSGSVDLGALLLFLTLVCWQMPHFYAISLYRSRDYAAAAIPVLPLVRGVLATKTRMLIYVVLFTIVSALLSVTGYTGFVYTIAMAIVCLLWLQRAAVGFRTNDIHRWARGMFGFSLVVLMVFCSAISFEAWLP